MQQGQPVSLELPLAQAHDLRRRRSQPVRRSPARCVGGRPARRLLRGILRLLDERADDERLATGA